MTKYNPQDTEEAIINIKLGEARYRKFNNDWLGKFSLEYNKIYHVRKCKLCRYHNTENIFTIGSIRYMIDSLYEHSISKDHINAYEDSILKKVLIETARKIYFGHSENFRRIYIFFCFLDT